MEMRPLLSITSRDQEAKNQQLELINANLVDVAADIAYIIEQVEGLREHLLAGERRRRDLHKREDRLWARLHLLQEKENELHRQKTVILSRSLLPGEPPQEALPPSVSPDAPASPPWHSKRQQRSQEHQEHEHPQQSQHQQEHRRVSHTHGPPVREDQENSIRPLIVPAPGLGSARLLNPPAIFTVSTAAGAAVAPTPSSSSRATPPAVASGLISSVGASRALLPTLPEAHAMLRRRPSRPGSAEDTGSGAE